MYIEKYEIAPKLANLRGAVPCSKQGAKMCIRDSTAPGGMGVAFLHGNDH